jgi:membrane fusion protein (multidrug efflux system)
MTEKKKWKENSKNGGRLVLLIIVPVAIIATGVFFYLNGGRYISTDNAYLKTDKVSISAEVSGRIVEVDVKDNTHIKKDDLLLKIDDSTYKIAVEQAEAKLASIKIDIESTRADYKQKEAELAKMEENIRYWERENVRSQKLLATHAIADTKAAEVTHELQNAIKERDSSKQELAAQLAKLAGNADIPVEEHPNYKEDVAELNKQKLNLSRVNITSPLDGISAHVSLEVGEYIAPGLPLFSIVDDSHVWIEANFKETDLTYVRPGQEATVEVDTYPGKKWKAKVAAITPATGAEFSILPSQNASGNWVKVVQRIMVKLEFEANDEKLPLSAGMSSYVSIDTGHTRLERWSGAQ